MNGEGRSWECAKCGGSALEHSLTTSACVWDPQQRGTVTDAEVDAAGRVMYERWGEWDEADEMATARRNLVRDALEAAREARS